MTARKKTTTTRSKKKKAPSPFAATQSRLRAAWAALEAKIGDSSGLRPGVDGDSNYVEDFGVTFDVSVPPEMEALYAVHDGERDGHARVCPPRRLLSVDEIAEATFAHMRRNEASARELIAGKKKARQKVDPQCTSYGAYLLVITTDDSKGGFLALDFEPSDEGTHGQVIEWSPSRIRFVAPNIAEWLEGLAE